MQSALQWPSPSHCHTSNTPSPQASKCLPSSSCKGFFFTYHSKIFFSPNSKDEHARTPSRHRHASNKPSSSNHIWRCSRRGSVRRLKRPTKVLLPCTSYETVSVSGRADHHSTLVKLDIFLRVFMHAGGSWGVNRRQHIAHPGWR